MCFCLLFYRVSLMLAYHNNYSKSLIRDSINVMSGAQQTQRDADDCSECLSLSGWLAAHGLTIILVLYLKLTLA